MLAKSYRLPARTHLIASKSHLTSAFVLRYAGNGLLHPRVGVVISKKVDKSAVRRNTLRRIIHHTVSPYFSDLSSQDLLFIVKPPAATIDTEQLTEQIKETLNKIIS